MGTTTSPAASALRDRLLKPLASDPDYWTFAADSRRTMGHALFNYPAMMVPQVQGALLDAWIATEKRRQLVVDPFAGSGTVMTESMLRGLDFRGVDINPLAVLLLRVKARPLKEQTLRRALADICATVARDRRTDMLTFRGRAKWFSDPVAIQLTKLHRAIASVASRDVRRFYWVCLAGTVRQVSNSRTSTFKLHVYEASVLEQRSVDAVIEFERIADENVTEATAQRDQLVSADMVARNGHYAGEIGTRLADVRSLKTPAVKADLLMTSPPYGDNRTTVPYGQYAFLPLSWIDRADLDGGDRLADLIATPYRTDVASLGGKAGPDVLKRVTTLGASSDGVRITAKLLQDLPGDGLRRFSTFVCDLDDAMMAINRQLRAGAFQFWTLGERSISGNRIPTTQIVTELAARHGCAHVVTLARNIPNGRKRMAIRNDTVGTMRAESILVLQGALSS
ncbi:hypothetical protein [Nocardioides mangrovi]|uniref:Site-specific DNA-methyltransferase (cytosine-N(4)-specific) n=1 Tax=Nocardioides mangrovi TaxID=2874580 RepID=A0ABS7UJ99_9ACTN|nr:hypothetical protein [Nocardioides mangrovi]MBZ5740667.1 hypothetical protein [Nocardioides mangrovi]